MVVTALDRTAAVRDAGSMVQYNLRASAKINWPDKN
jgi:hypothetical protein